MAPRGNAKRAAEVSVDEPAHKKFATVLKKNGVTQATFKQVAEVLEHPMSSYLPDDCKKMLLAMLPQSLCVPSDQREDAQNLAVTMMAEVVASIEGKLQQVVDEETEKVAEVENSKSSLTDGRTAAEAALEAALERVASCESWLLASSEAVVVAKADVSKCEAAQREGDAALLQAETEKAELEKALAGDFNTLKVGEWTDSPKKHIEAIQPLLNKLSMDESLKTAQQSVLTKKPCDRGGFDCTVMDQLDKCFQAKIEELAGFLESGKAAREARAERLSEAKVTLEAAEGRQKEHSTELLEAKQQQKEAAGVLKEAEKAEAQFEPMLQAANKTRDEKQKELQLFQDCAVACFQQLKDRISLKRQREQAKAAAEAKAQEEAKAAAEAKAQEEAKAAAEAKAQEEAEAKTAAETQALEQAKKSEADATEAAFVAMAVDEPSIAETQVEAVPMAVEEAPSAEKIEEAAGVDSAVTEV